VDHCAPYASITRRNGEYVERIRHQKTKHYARSFADDMRDDNEDFGDSDDNQPKIDSKIEKLENCYV
jgi:hypothetical protein